MPKSYVIPMMTPEDEAKARRDGYVVLTGPAASELLLFRRQRQLSMAGALVGREGAEWKGIQWELRKELMGAVLAYFQEKGQGLFAVQVTADAEMDSNERGMCLTSTVVARGWKLEDAPPRVHIEALWTSRQLKAGLDDVKEDTTPGAGGAVEASDNG